MRRRVHVAHVDGQRGERPDAARERRCGQERDDRLTLRGFPREPDAHVDRLDEFIPAPRRRGAGARRFFREENRAIETAGEEHSGSAHASAIL